MTVDEPADHRPSVHVISLLCCRCCRFGWVHKGEPFTINFWAGFSPTDAIPTASKHWRQLKALSAIRENHCRSITGGIMLHHFWESPTGPVLFVILFNWVRRKEAAQCRCRLSDASTDDRASPSDDLSITAHRWLFTYFTSLLWQLLAVSASCRW